jgi:hypothetical protein
MSDLIDWALSALSVAVPGLGVWGIVIKIATRLGLGWAASATTGPVVGLIAKAAEGLVNIGVWLVMGVLGYAGAKLAEAVDHITKSVPATLLLVAVAWGAWTAGVGRATPERPPAAATAPATAVPKAPPKAPSGQPKAQAPPIDPIGWLDSIWR